MATPPHPTPPPHVPGNKASIVVIGKFKICRIVFRHQLRPRSVRLIIRNPSLDSRYSPRASRSGPGIKSTASLYFYLVHEKLVCGSTGS